MNENITALIAARSDELREALQALLESIGHINAMYQAHNQRTVDEIITSHQPGLILADFDLFTVITKQHHPIIIVLVDNRKEYDCARSEGAEYAFVKGTSVSQLVSTIESLLNIDGNDARGGEIV